jgi:hypothetical protein
LVNHEYQCIFVHIPKVAGTSIKAFLEERDSARQQRDPMPFKVDDFKFDPPPPHLRATDHVKYGFVTASQFETYFKFAFVRNPWERLVSEFLYRRHPLRFDFKTFVFERLPKPAWSDEYCHIIPQYDFLHDEQGRLAVDFVGRFETLSDDFSTVRERIGLPRTSIPHLNRFFDHKKIRSPSDLANRVRYLTSRKRRRNTHENYRDYYDTETREFVAELYRNDIETFGYRFE